MAERYRLATSDSSATDLQRAVTYFVGSAEVNRAGSCSSDIVDAEADSKSDTHVDGTSDGEKNSSTTATLRVPPCTNVRDITSIEEVSQNPVQESHSVKESQFIQSDVAPSGSATARGRSTASVAVYVEDTDSDEDGSTHWGQMDQDVPPSVTSAPLVADGGLKPAPSVAVTLAAYIEEPDSNAGAV
jgi:hypothetical protein